VRDVICDRGAGDDDIGGNGFGNHRLGPQRRPHGGGSAFHGLMVNQLRTMCGLHGLGT
jgi:hypothetical protein